MKSLGDILVLGLGRSGDAAARYCCGLLGGEADSVTVVEESDSGEVARRAGALRDLGARVHLGTNGIAGAYDLCIASPGIKPGSALMLNARAVSGELISELEFAFRRSSSPWVAVTGTNGKTTTTALIAHLLNEAGIAAHAVGNIGVPAISVVHKDMGGVLVAEASSFQLALVDTFRPRVAALLNITRDHVDWHGSFENYMADKVRIFENMGGDDVAVIDVDDAGSAPFASLLAGRGIQVARVSAAGAADSEATVSAGVLTLSTHSGPVRLCKVDELLIRGSHNVSNALVAACVAHAMGASISPLRAGLASFRPIEHRLEPAGQACGAEWFNDSKATNPDAVLKALDAFSGRDFVLLLGGRNKGNDFRPLARAATGVARAIIAFGEAGPEIADAFATTGGTCACVDSLSAAVRAACEAAAPGDAVVLSPACASFDEFTDYEERGRAFKRMVTELGEERCP